MNLIKMMGIFLLFLSFTAGGGYISLLCKKRVEALHDTRLMVAEMITKLRFSMLEPKSLIKELCHSKPNCNAFLNTILENLKDTRQLSVIWNEGINTGTPYLKNEDREILKKIGETLGASDVETQLRQLSLIENQLMQQYERIYQDCEKNSKLSVNMGVLTGIGIAIFLI